MPELLPIENLQPRNIAVGRSERPQGVKQESGRLDLTGIALSVVCALHCVAVPFLVAAVPMVTAVRWLADPLVHQTAAVVCSVFAFRSFWPGLRRHQVPMTEVFAISGLALLLVAAFVLPAACCDAFCGQSVGGSRLTSWITGNSWGHSLISAEAVGSRWGMGVLDIVTGIQAWLTPIGGVSLALAHAFHLRSRLHGNASLCGQANCSCGQ